MKIAFVFPGQGSQIGRHARRIRRQRCGRRRACDAPPSALGQDLVATDRARSGRRTRPDRQYAAVHAGRVGGHLRSVARCRRRRTGDDGRHSRSGSTRRWPRPGAFTLEQAVPLVRVRAKAMQEATPVGSGAMAAILGLDDDAVRAACAEAAQGEVVEPVNFNAPSQVVIAGHKAAVERACAAAKQRGAKRAVPLAGIGTVPLVAAAARERRAARHPERRRPRGRARAGRQQRRRRDRVGSRAHSRCAGAPGSASGALGRGGPALR